jgi:hypothetical protein
MMRALEACKHLAILSAKMLAGSCDRRASESAGSAESPLASTSRSALESAQGELQNTAVLVHWRKHVVDPTSSSVGRHWQPPKAVQRIEVILFCSYVPAASQGRRFVASDGALLSRHFRVWCDVMALPHRRDDILWPHAIARSGGGRLPAKGIAMVLPCYVSATDLLLCVAMLLPCYCHVDEI